MRARFAAVMLAAAPPKSRRVRSRTSTNTSVSPSRATRSISPQRRRKLRSTIVDAARGEKLGGQCLGASTGLAARDGHVSPAGPSQGLTARGSERGERGGAPAGPARCAAGREQRAWGIHRSRRRGTAPSRPSRTNWRVASSERCPVAPSNSSFPGGPAANACGDVEGVDAERVEPVERGVGVIRPLQSANARRSGSTSQGMSTNRTSSRSRSASRRLALVDLAARVGGDRPDVGLGQRGVRGVDGEESRVDRGLDQFAPQQPSTSGARSNRNITGAPPPARIHSALKALGEALLHRRVAGDDGDRRRAVVARAARKLPRLAVDRQRERVDVLRQRHALVELVQRDGRRQLEAGRRERFQVVADQRPDDDPAPAASPSRTRRPRRRHRARSPCGFAFAASAAARNPACTASAARPNAADVSGSTSTMGTGSTRASTTGAAAALASGAASLAAAIARRTMPAARTPAPARSRRCASACGHARSGLFGSGRSSKRGRVSHG